MYEELVKRLREWANSFCGCCKHADKKQKACDDCTAVYGSLWEAADAIEELQDKVNRAVRFYDSVETAEFMRGLNECLPNILDPAWQKAHMEMGFYSPVGEVYKAIGIYDEPPESDGE